VSVSISQHAARQVVFSSPPPVAECCFRTAGVNRKMNPKSVKQFFQKTQLGQILVVLALAQLILSIVAADILLFKTVLV
jgi:hypothetical protein